MATTRDHFSIDGHPITFESFHEYCVDLVSTAESWLTTVLRGCPLDGADKLITNTLRIGQTSNIFFDRLRDVGAGYSFMSDPNNPLASGKSLLIQHFLRAGCHDFSIHTPSGAHPRAFRPLECAIWLSDVDRLVEALYAATVATWPGAGRGTELDHLTYNNQRGQRHLFLINNILTFITSYSKTQKMTGKAQLIPRGVDPRLARVFIITLNYVYYAAQVITHQIGDDSSSSAYSKYIFVHRSTLLNTDAMTHILRSFTNDHFHYQDEDEEQDANRAPINSLFGHGQRIADTVYGIEADSLMDLTQPDVARAHRYSIVYQKALSLWTDFSLDALGLPNEEKSTPSNPIVAPPLDAASRLQIAKDLEDILNTRLPAFGDQIASTLSRALYHHIPNLLTSFPPLLPSSTTVNVHPSQLKCLQRLFRSKSFKSPEQATIFEYILQNLCSVFGILGTGGGKSLMFYGPPLVEPSGITPRNNSPLHSIPVSMWPNDNINFDTVRLIIVPAHEAGTELFVNFVKATVDIKKFKRIIYDKAHQILMSGYCSCYNNLSCIAVQNVPLHFLSATLLPQSVAAIAHAARLHPDTFCVICTTTVRPNLRYVDEDFSTEKDNRQVLERVTSICHSEYSKLEEKDRILIYCSSYDECDALNVLLGYPVYKSKIEDRLDPSTNASRRKAISDDWRVGNPRTLIATTSFGNGINYAHVRLVVTLNPYNTSDAVQQTGRAGCDGCEATCYLFNTHRHPVPRNGTDDHGGICLGNLDEHMYSCVAHGSSHALLCSRCEVLESRTSVMLAPASIGGLTSHANMPSSSMQVPSSSRHPRNLIAQSSPLHPASSFSPPEPPFPQRSANPLSVIASFTPPPNMSKCPQTPQTPHHLRNTPASQNSTPSSFAGPSRTFMAITTPSQAASSGKSRTHNTPLSPIRVPIYPHDGVGWRWRSQVSPLIPGYTPSLPYCPTEVLSQSSLPPSPTPSSTPRLSKNNAPRNDHPTVSALPPCPPMPKFHATMHRTQPTSHTTNSVLESRQAAVEASLALRATRATYLVYIPKFFELCKIGCIMCLVFGRDYCTCPAITTTSGPNPTAIYNAYSCSQGLINPSNCCYTIPSLGNAGLTYKPHFRNSLSFPPRHKICYNCASNGAHSYFKRLGLLSSPPLRIMPLGSRKYGTPT
ncbi:hypothetical protein BDN71DRAFT_1434505 [Pleurotus eryngii]|uniref:DNA 3'-5' helicase n=1 Tax=Pleurotus eryngii TaxID=5323 RepID=A0A9P5ZNF2_PLEER|nr:hypothetical protein BDN71DRAFT_1434505 [Pleurotus eryngii]